MLYLIFKKKTHKKYYLNFAQETCQIIFSIIANDKEVIDGFKNSIVKLSQLLDKKEYLIKPIFTALCSKNAKMADWTINKFLDIDATQK